MYYHSFLFFFFSPLFLSFFQVLLQILPCSSLWTKSPPPPGGGWPEYISLFSAQWMGFLMSKANFDRFVTHLLANKVPKTFECGTYHTVGYNRHSEEEVSYLDALWKLIHDLPRRLCPLMMMLIITIRTQIRLTNFTNIHKLHTQIQTYTNWKAE